MRSEALRELTERCIGIEELAGSSDLPDAAPFDLLCHWAWNAPLLTGLPRAAAARRRAQDLFGRFEGQSRRLSLLSRRLGSAAGLKNSTRYAR